MITKMPQDKKYCLPEQLGLKGLIAELVNMSNQLQKLIIKQKYEQRSDK